MDVLVIEKVRGLHEAFVAQTASERPVRGVFVRPSVAHERVMLFEAHLALVAVKGPLLGVRALVLPQVRRPFKPLPACGAAKRSGTLRVAGMVKQFRRLFEVQLAQVALEQVLARVNVHVADEVRAVLEALFAHSALERPLVAVRPLVVL